MPKRKSNDSFRFLLAAVVLIVLVIGVVWLINRNRTSGETQVTSTGATTTSDVGKPKPVTQVFDGCPPSGDGGDPLLNTLKNRIDEASWQPSTVETLLSYTWPRSIERLPRYRWSKSDAQDIAKYEGMPVQVEGYLVDAKRMGPESCNCHSVSDVDFHIWLVDSPNKGRAESIVIETSPRVRIFHPEWTLSDMRKIINDHQKVRISGWLMLDPEHPDQIGKTRGTIWEIHPVMQIETQSIVGWAPLDNGTTGVKSEAVAQATLPPITPESTASLPPVGSTNVQRNQDVQITSVYYDGKKRSEPDEFVEIANKGNAPVDITDWELQDPSGNNEYKWENSVIQPGATIRVFTNETHNDSGGFSFGSKNPIWNNSGDVAELYDADKVLVSRFAYGNKK